MSKKSKKGKKRSKAKPVVEKRAYEAAQSTPQRRPVVGGNLSQDAASQAAYPRLRNFGRYLDENHDVVTGILDEQVKSIVGAGIITIPTPMNPDGSINHALGEIIMRWWKKWIRQCDVTGELSWSESQRLICRAWMRDGEEFINHVNGTAYPYPEGSTPYRIELLESDMVPHDLVSTDEEGWRQGVRLNAWRQPTAYAVYKKHPGDFGIQFGGSAATFADLKIVPARDITHIKNTKRWPATRGVSALHSVITRLEDIKDLEESERLSNRVLSSWTAAVKKSPDVPGWNPHDTESGSRYLQMAGGTIIDTLAPGEDIVGVGPDYPRNGVADYISDQFKRVASGTGTRYSSIAKDYNGTYAAQRQELVESEGHYKMREDVFVKVCRSVYERWLMTAVLAQQIPLAPGMDLHMASQAEYRGPVTPWIDPLKETNADIAQINAGITDLTSVQIKRGAPDSMIGKPAPKQQEMQLTSSDDREDEDTDEEDEAA